MSSKNACGSVFIDFMVHVIRHVQISATVKLNIRGRLKNVRNKLGVLHLWLICSWLNIRSCLKHLQIRCLRVLPAFNIITQRPNSSLFAAFSGAQP